MARGEAKARDVSAFLEGDPNLVQEVHSAIDFVVRAFHFTEPDLHKDLVQEALCGLYASLRDGRYRGESSIKTYAQNVARYTCLGYLRSRRQDREIDFETIPCAQRWSGPEDQLLHEEEHLRNVRAFLALPRECRELFRLIFIEGLSYREVGQQLGLSEAGIKSRVHRCRLAGRELAQAESVPAPQVKKRHQIRRTQPRVKG